ncbi:hypothetical protein [Limnoglobus roseus]|uniref:Uncharacterized protein n=1 Tax=Limnoglobus roseus TaxID=2598579 RepID=A0A5C1AN48_9BACT|nr:hypothetical protein [Limnoglobus roseus]QEL20839.1 hypothetical protein PX52LOC_07959 [Limnoglobus roseus]
MPTLADSHDALAESVTALRRLADYTLPVELDRRILDLSQRKEDLTAEERAELLAWVQFSQQRSLEKFGATVALERLAVAFPDLANPT